MEIKQKNICSKNTFTGQIINSQQKHQNYLQNKAYYEYPKKEYVFEEYINVIKNEHNNKTSLIPSPKLLIRENFYKKKNIPLKTNKFPPSTNPIKMEEISLDNFNERQNSSRKLYPKKNYEIMNPFKERSLSESKSCECFIKNSWCNGRNVSCEKINIDKNVPTKLTFMKTHDILYNTKNENLRGSGSGRYFCIKNNMSIKKGIEPKISMMKIDTSNGKNDYDFSDSENGINGIYSPVNKVMANNKNEPRIQKYTFNYLSDKKRNENLKQLNQLSSYVHNSNSRKKAEKLTKEPNICLRRKNNLNNNICEDNYLNRPVTTNNNIQNNKHLNIDIKNNNKINMNKLLSHKSSQISIKDNIFNDSNNNNSKVNVNISNNHINGAENNFNTFYNTDYIEFNNNENNNKVTYYCNENDRIYKLKNELNSLGTYKENKIKTIHESPTNSYPNDNSFICNNLLNNSSNDLEYLNSKMREISERELYEQSAILIQSAFRGHLKKRQLEDLLFFFPKFSKATEILENIFIKYIFKKILTFLQNKRMLKKNINRSCQDFNFEGRVLDLHKEIGESFNILNNKNIKCEEVQTIGLDIEKEYKKKLEENMKVLSRLISENHRLKNINNKNKDNELEIKRVSLENKKKQNIIDIVTNDNQNLAKKLKSIKEKQNMVIMQNQVGNFNIINENNGLDIKVQIKNMSKLFIYIIKNSIKGMLKNYFQEMKTNIGNKNKQNNYRKKILLKIINANKNKEYYFLRSYFNKFYYNGLFSDNDKQQINYKKISCINFINTINNILKINKKINLQLCFNKLRDSNEKNNNKINSINEFSEINKLKKAILKIENKSNSYNSIKFKNIFVKWNLMSKLISMKTQADEKKRKKRQKQRLKKKIENRLLNTVKFPKTPLNNNSCNANIITNKTATNNQIQTDKEKEKDVVILVERSVTTDLSNNEINGGKYERIMKATEKLNELFTKAAINYKLFSNKEQNNNENKGNNENYENDYEEDSGDSFGI